MRDLRHEELQRLLIMAQNKGKEKLSCAIYARKSREDLQKISLETQISECKAFIKDNSSILTLEGGAIFHEDNVSGMSESRPQFRKLIEGVEQHRYDVVICTKIDRFSRDSQNTLKFLNVIEQSGAYFIAGDDLGDNSAAGILIKQVMWATSEFLVRRAVEDGMRVKSQRTLDGYSAGGVGNYGYKVEGKRYVVDPYESAAVALIFRKFIQGASYKEIIDELEVKGFKTRKGKRFAVSTINAILTNVRNTGVNVWNAKAKRKDRKRISKMVFDEVVCEEATEAIVSKEDFDLVQDMLLGRASHKPNRAIHHDYLLTGLIKCASCGSSMVGNSHYAGRAKKMHSVYICPKHQKKNGGSCETKDINATYLDTYVKELVLVQLQRHQSQVDLRAVLAPHVEKNLLSLQRQAERCTKELTKVSLQSDRLVEALYSSDSESVRMRISAKLGELDQQHKSWKRLLEESHQHFKDINEKVEEFITSSIDSETLFKSPKLSRILMREFITSISVSNEQVKVKVKG